MISSCSYRFDGLLALRSHRIFREEGFFFLTLYLPFLPSKTSFPICPGPGSTLNKEIKLFSKGPSVLFDLSEVSQVSSQALNLNLPFSSSTCTFNTYASQTKDPKRNGWGEKKSIIPIPLKVQTASGYPSIDLLLLHSIACGTFPRCSLLTRYSSSQSLFSLF